MHIAIVHYHLQPGGVFQVITNHLESLRNVSDATDEYQVAIFHGDSSDDVSNIKWPDSSRVRVSAHAVAELGYDHWPESPVDSTGLAANLLTAFKERGFSPADTVIHVHNHSLGKNVSLPGALQILAGHGYPLLLQIHDFAEDFRVEQYQKLSTALDSPSHGMNEIIYPQAPHIHYAVLNGRDRDILSKSGLPTDRLHALPNPIVALGPLPEKIKVRQKMRVERGISEDHPLVIYPVRGIRRKNLGELLLWSTLFKNRASFGTTLAPQNDAEKVAYARWKSVAEDLRLACHFELGESFSFKENIASADALITTSVAEGFGMVFLESQLVGRPLLGRDLPEITSEFEKNKIKLALLYQTLDIPIDLLGKDRIYDNVLCAYLDVSEAFKSAAQHKKEAQNALGRILSSEVVDFSLLTPLLQEEIILHVHEHREAGDRILDLNPILEKSLFAKHSQKMLVSNKQAVQKHYDASSIGVKLQTIYKQVLQSPRAEAVCCLSHEEKVLDSFLSLERFRPIRSMS